jgi:hypothetical protein
MHQSYTSLSSSDGGSEKWRLKFTQDHYILTAFCSPYFHMDNYSRVFSRAVDDKVGETWVFLARELRFGTKHFCNAVVTVEIIES